MQSYQRLHGEYPLREFYFVPTAREDQGVREQIMPIRHRMHYPHILQSNISPLRTLSRGRIRRSTHSSPMSARSGARVRNNSGESIALLPWDDVLDSSKGLDLRTYVVFQQVARDVHEGIVIIAVDAHAGQTGVVVV
jgi:hypothetical protein